MSNARPDRGQPPTAQPPERSHAGEYGEGAAHEATGVGPRNPRTADQRLNDQPGQPDPYGNVAAGRYGSDGYSSSPGHPQSYAPEARAPRVSGSNEHTDGPAMQRDEELRELIRQRLTEDPTLDASDVSIEVRSGRVTLAGTVPSTRAKAEIEQTIENCGARELDNQLRALS